MKTLQHFAFLFVLSLLGHTTFAQQTIDLQENKAAEVGGLEIGYNITNEQKKEAGGEMFSRYEITVYVTNYSGCHRFFLQDDRILHSFTHTPSTIAIFDCVNANGKRLTSKNATVSAKPFYVPVTINETKDGKTVSNKTKVQGGYVLRNGDSATNNLIVIVPLGERPVFKCRTVNASEF
jgi:hypothetical protein